MSQESPIRVLFSCTGIGICNRGIESFFREAFDGLKDVPGIEARLIKGVGKSTADEWVVPCFRRTGKIAPWLGRMTSRTAYAVEQWSSFPAVVKHIRRFRPQVIFYSEANLGFLLYRFRRQIGVPFRLLFSNGGPCNPPFDRCDFVHQVAPLYRAEAVAAGEEPGRHLLVPYGIQMSEPPEIDLEGKRLIRIRLGLPIDRPVVLSVGWIAREHKRMHYVIEEVARMPEPRPFLQILGAIDEKSPEIIELAEKLLGSGNFSARSVPYSEVSLYYQAVDCFVLGSLREGFGRVYLEALMHGIPTIGHSHPVIEYVLGEAGIVADLSQPGVLCQVLTDTLRAPYTAAAMRRRWQSVSDRFGWGVLSIEYLEMFRTSADGAFQKE